MITSCYSLPNLSFSLRTAGGSVSTTLREIHLFSESAFACGCQAKEEREREKKKKSGSECERTR